MTTGEYLVSISTISSGTMLEHFCNIETGSVQTIIRSLPAVQVSSAVVAQERVKASVKVLKSKNKVTVKQKSNVKVK
jgi:hypothetical protein